MTNRKPGNK